MPAGCSGTTWQGSLGETIRALVNAGADQEEAIALAYAMAEQHGATKPVDVVPLTSITRRAHVAGLSDTALAVACHRSAIIRSAYQRQRMTKVEIYLRAEASRRWTQRWANDHAGPNPGVMLAVRMPAELAKIISLADGELPEALHCTIGYLGRMSDVSADGLTKARDAIAKVAAATPALQGRIGGMGRFAASKSTDGLDVIFAALDVPGLSDLRHACAAALEAAGVPVRKDHDFNPHVTLAYVGESDPTPEMTGAVRDAPLTIDKLALVVGDKLETELPLAPAPSDLQLKSRIFRAAPEQRYTLSVAYPVAEADAHGNFANSEQLERACWEYLRRSRAVGLMHKNGTAGTGELVENYIYRGPDWTIEDQTVRAGDWIAGIIWSPEAWEFVKAGDFQGLSFQGFAEVKSATPPPSSSQQRELPLSAPPR
jgi:2'-5' RNA ligase